MDFYHVSEYLSAAAASIAPTGAAAWRQQQQARLKENNAEAVRAELRPHLEPAQTPDAEATVRVCHRYLTNQGEPLDYRSALAQNLPIGSGEVECGHRYVIQARLKRPGAWWKEENAEKMLALRVNRANCEWESYWQRQRQGAACFSVLLSIALIPVQSEVHKPMNNPLIDELAERIWDYMHMHHVLAKSDLILALGSNDLRVAAHAADLYLQGWVPRLLFSGNVGVLTRSLFDKPEAEKFAEVALRKGVPATAILLEAESTNTGDNVRFSRRVLAEHGIEPQRIILVQKPYMERRAYATFMNFWPGIKLIVSSPPIPFTEYPTAQLSKDTVINIMVGDLQRIREYPAKGFQIPQPIPDTVWQAFEQLVALGYDKHLIQ